MISHLKFFVLKLNCLFTIGIIGITSYSLSAQISGTVYNDLNVNGQQDQPFELGVGNVIVSAFLSNGNEISTNTDNAGLYNFTSNQIPLGEKARIEFSNLRGAYAGLKGPESNSTVVFTTGGQSDISLGILNSDQYCGLDNPMILTSCYVNGDPLGGGSAGEDVALVTFPYSASGLAGVGGGTPLNYVSKIKTVGSVWGMTYQASLKKFLVSGLVRRHSGLGPLGTGGIYLVDDLTKEATPFVDVKQLGIDTGDDPRVNALGQNIALPADKLVGNEDSLTLHTAGKMGIGSITLSQDEQTLFFVNLFDKKLYSFEVGKDLSPPLDNSTVKSYNIPDPSGTGEYRPWSVTERNGDLYLGVVSSAEISQDTSLLDAFIYKLDLTSGLFSQILTFPLSYKKGFSDVTGNCIDIDTWRPWSDVFPAGCANFFDGERGKWVNFAMNPQPILSSIAFDTDGSMIIGFMDRFGLFSGYRNLRPVDDGMLYDGFVGGDVLRAQYDPFSNSFELEQNGISGELVGVGAGNNEGPGGGEFFGDDVWIFKGNPAHAEITNGGVLVVPSAGEVMVTSMDPVNEIYQSGGIRTFDRTNGALKRAYALYSDVPGTLGKSGGVGEFKTDCDPAPIEIGNRIWDDVDKDGIQDPEENGIDGLIVTLHDMSNGGAEIGRIETANEGIFCFNSINTPNLDYYKDYEIRLNCDQANSVLNDFVTITIKDNDPAEGGDARDSDGEKVGNDIVIKLNSGFPGQTIHDYDLGLVRCAVPITINPLVDLDFCEQSIPIIDFEDAPLGAEWSLAQNYLGVSIDATTGLIQGISEVGQYKFYLSNQDNNFCKDSVLVTIWPKPNAGIDIKICSSTSDVLLQGSPLGGKWRVAVGNPGLVTFNENTGQISQINNLGIYKFIYGVNGCEDTVSVERIALPFAGNDTTICSYYSTFSLNGNPEGGAWRVDSENTNFSVISNSGEVSGYTANGTYKYIYTVDGCEDTLNVQIENCPLGAIGNYAWFDANQNGIQDNIIDPLDGSIIGPENPVEGVRIILCQEGVSDPLDSMLTDANGKYLFTGLLPGNYYLKFDPSTLPSSTFLLTGLNIGSDRSIDNDFSSDEFKTGIIELSMGEVDTTWDIGFYTIPPIVPTISDLCVCNPDLIYIPEDINGTNYIFNDRVDITATPGSVWRIIPEDFKTGIQTFGMLANTSGSAEPIPLDAIGMELEVNPNLAGGYFIEFAHSESVGYGIAVTDGVDTLSIFNSCTSIKEEFDPRLNEVCAFDPSFVLQTEFETGTASYFLLQESRFEYSQEVDIETLIANAQPITEFDPSRYPSNSTIAIYIKWLPKPELEEPGVKVCEKSVFLNVEITVDTKCLSSIGDFVWIDENENGRQDAGEGGLPNVSVTLLDENGSPVLEDAFGNTLIGKTTHADGFYKFSNLIPGSYQVQFGKPTGYVLSTQNASAVDDTQDSDANAITGVSHLVTLQAGEFNQTIDAGFKRDCKEICVPISIVILR